MAYGKKVVVLVESTDAAVVLLFGRTHFPVASRYLVSPDDPNHATLIRRAVGSVAPINIGGEHFAGTIEARGPADDVASWARNAPLLPTALPPTREVQVRPRVPKEEPRRLYPANVGYQPPAKPKPLTSLGFR